LNDFSVVYTTRSTLMPESTRYMIWFWDTATPVRSIVANKRLLTPVMKARVEEDTKIIFMIKYLLCCISNMEVRRRSMKKAEMAILNTMVVT